MTGALVAFPLGAAFAATQDELLAAMPDTGPERASYVDSTSALRGVIEWDDAGQVIFAHPESLAGADRAAQLRGFQQAAGQGADRADPAAPNQKIHCRSAPALCMVLSPSVGAQPVEDKNFAYFLSVMSWFYVIIALGVALVIGFFLMLRRRPKNPYEPES